METFWQVIYIIGNVVMLMVLMYLAVQLFKGKKKVMDLKRKLSNYDEGFFLNSGDDDDECSQSDEPRMQLVLAIYNEKMAQIDRIFICKLLMLALVVGFAIMFKYF
jgi:cell division protein FtsL